jgi:predicted nucleic acid-binding protein
VAKPPNPLPPRLFCDTSFFYACLDLTDANHDRARALAEAAAASRAGMWTTWDVVSETVTLLRYRGSFRTALPFLDEVKPRLHLVRYGDRVRDGAEELFRRYGQDHRVSWCDAISFVVVTTLLDRMPCLAFDEDFRRLGLTVVG